MNVRKHHLATLEAVYAVATFPMDGEMHLLAASEGRGRCLLFSPPGWKATEVLAGPGGAMSLMPLPEHPGTFLAIQGLFPVFQSENCGIVLAQRRGSCSEPWEVRQVIDLPFVHRFEVVMAGGAPTVVASTLCGGKASADDWSLPGAVYAGRVPDDPRAAWSVKPILTGLAKNHGMHVATFDGKTAVLIGAQEGVFLLRPPVRPSDSWEHECLLDHEISDISACDVDGDGKLEILAIEPLHGNTLAIYKSFNGRWQPIFEKSILEFGHVVWGGTILGEPTAIVGWRRGTKELSLWQFRGGAPLVMEKIFREEGVGPSQVAVFHEQGRDLILSANHGVNEVALYEVTP
jgi:hypothetical protein